MGPDVPHIALFAPSMRGAGMERVFLNLCKGFVEAGVRVDLVLAHAAGPYLEGVPDEVNVVDLGVPFDLSVGIVSLVDRLRHLPGLTSYLRGARPHILLSSGVFLNAVALVANALAGAPATVVFRQPVHLSSMLAQLREDGNGRLREALVRLLYPHADGIIANATELARDLRVGFGVPAEKLEVLPNPFLLAYPSGSLLSSARSQLESDERPLVLGAGRLVPQKDFETLIAAFAMVRRSRDCRLMILGEGPQRDSLQAMIEDLSLSKDAILVGHVGNPHEFMKRADVFVLSSRFEGLPNVLIEALASGCSIVSTNCPSGPSEILEDGKYGRLVDVGDVSGVAAAIIEGLDETPDEKRLEARARDYDYRRIAEDYLDFMLRCRGSGLREPESESQEGDMVSTKPRENRPQDSHLLEGPFCTLCREQDYQVLQRCEDRRYDTGFRGFLVKCCGCGLVSTLPRPSEEEIGGYYRKSYAVYRVRGDKFQFSPFLRRVLSPGSRLPEALRQPLLDVYNFAAFRSLPDLPPGRALDVGAGVGDFVANLAQLGWDAVGVEPSPRACEQARNSGRKVLDGTIFASELDGRTFDLITFWHVLEHVHRPVEVLQRAASLLAKDGVLMLAVPNWLSIKRRILGDSWWRMEVPRHLYHFSPATLSKTLQAGGFRVCRLQCKTSAAQLTNIIKLMPETRLSPYHKALEIGLTPAELVASWWGSGDDIWAVASRPRS